MSTLKLLRLTALILGANCFFPVSCTISLIAGAKVAEKLDERDVSKGETVHSQFSVAVEPGEADNSFRVLKLTELAEPDKRPATFLLSKPEGHIKINSVSTTYKVLEDTDQEQLVEVVQRVSDGDWTTWSRYRASQDSVRPVWSKFLYFGQMFAALPWALIAALVLHFIGRCLQRRLDSAARPPAI
jgi:hypothetical protein